MMVSFIKAGDKPVSFLTVVGPSLRSVKVESNNTAYMNGMKIIASRTIKSGDNWVRTVKVVPRY